MAKTYTSTIPVKVRKQHTCVGCGGAFSYVFERKITGTGTTADRATALAKKNAEKALATEVDLYPCPTCGLYQPGMIGQTQGKKHRAIFWLLLIALIVLVIMRAAYGLNADVAAWAIAAVCGVGALLHAAVDRTNWNRDVEGNRQLASDRVSSAALVLNAPGRVGTPADELLNPPKSMAHRLAIPLLFAGVALTATPELVRGAKHWPANAAAYPPVVGPADTTRLYMQSKITSVKGYWRGTPTVTMTPEGGHEVTVQATTNSNSWGDHISAKSSEKSDTSHPWVEVTLPDDASLAGKKARCAVNLEVTYPQMSGSSTFETIHDALHESFDLQLAPAHAGTQYNALWWEGVGFGALLVLVCGRILASGSRALVASAAPAKLMDV